MLLGPQCGGASYWKDTALCGSAFLVGKHGKGSLVVGIGFRQSKFGVLTNVACLGKPAAQCLEGTWNVTWGSNDRLPKVLWNFLNVQNIFSSVLSLIVLFLSVFLLCVCFFFLFVLLLGPHHM